MVKVTKNHLIFSLVILFACLYIVFVFMGSRRDIDKLYNFSKETGYASSNFLVQYKSCWDIFPSHCGEFFYFTTAMTMSEFQKQLNKVVDSSNIFEVSADGYTIFSVNFDSNHSFTINDISDLSQVMPPRPSAYKWVFKHGGEDWVIVFYDISSDGNIYRFDGRQIQDNIVSIMLQTK